MKSFDIEKFPEFDKHKEIKFFSDDKAGLKSFVAIHNDNLGPATGGTRIWPYISVDEAIRDVLKLSRAMTYKCAIAGLKFGGGKGVIIGDPKKDKNPTLLKTYARLITEYFGSRFTTGTDVGLTDEDVKLMRRESPYFLGVIAEDKLNGSKMASLGVFYSIQGVLEVATGSGEIKGKSFAIKGLGKTGMELARLLTEKGAKIFAAEIDKEKINEAVRNFPGIKIVDEKLIYKQEVDVYCPCALGGDLNEKTVGELKCRFVVGTANNQLSANEIGDMLWQRKITYGPDFVVNAGALINVVDELEPGGYQKERVLNRVTALKDRIKSIIILAEKENKPSQRIACQMAEEIFLKK